MWQCFRLELSKTLLEWEGVLQEAFGGISQRCDLEQRIRLVIGQIAPVSWLRIRDFLCNEPLFDVR